MKRFPQVVAIVTLVLVLASVVATFVGAFMKGELGRGILFAGIFGFVVFAILGWVMIAIYNRVHKDEETNESLEASEDASAE